MWFPIDLDSINYPVLLNLLLSLEKSLCDLNYKLISYEKKCEFIFPNINQYTIYKSDILNDSTLDDNQKYFSPLNYQNLLSVMHNSTREEPINIDYLKSIYRSITGIKNDSVKQMNELNKILEFANDNQINIYIRVCISFLLFEKLSPFKTANELINCFLVTKMLYNENKLYKPFIYILEEICTDPSFSTYISIADSDGLTDWIHYFISIILNHVNKQCKYLDDLEELYHNTLRIVSNEINSANVEMIVVSLFNHLNITSTQLKEILNVTQMQAKRYLIKLEELGIVEANSNVRNVKYYFSEYYRLLKKI